MCGILNSKIHIVKLWKSFIDQILLCDPRWPWQCTLHSATHADFVALATHVTNSIFPSPKNRTCLMTVWSLSLTMLRYLSQRSNRTTIYYCPVDWQHRRKERSGVTQPCHCEAERNWSLAHFLCHFLMGLLSGWLEGGTVWRGETREVDVYWISSKKGGWLQSNGSLFFFTLAILLEAKLGSRTSWSSSRLAEVPPERLVKWNNSEFVDTQPFQSTGYK